MPQVLLIHWKAEEARERLGRLRATGYDAAWFQPRPDYMKRLRLHPPLAVVIDLSRLPAQGRDLAVALRSAKATRQLPLVFVEGKPEKVSRIRKLLPDATYTNWKRIRSALRRAIAHPPVAPVATRSAMDGYAGVPLPRKLGINPNTVVALVGAPTNFRKSLGRLPKGVKLHSRASGRTDLTLWFVKSRKELDRYIRRMAPLAEGGGLWIVWPKKTSHLASDLSQAVVRKVGLAAGIVDYKISALDATWSGLRFTQRKSSKSRR